jgi:uncharacterized protein (TIGR03790 family)
VRRFLTVAAAFSFICVVHAEGLNPDRLGVLYNADDASSTQIARFYAVRRAIPPENVVGLHFGSANVLAPEALAPIRKYALDRLPGAVQSLALVWSRPFAVGCMSITTAFAAGYRAEFCVPGCALTAPNLLFDSEGWLPADTVGWWPAMLIPTDDPARARALIERGIAADGSAPAGAVYLVRTKDPARNVRAATYADVEQMQAQRYHIVELSTPITKDLPAAIAYFTGAVRVEEMEHIRFLPGAIADHLTSTGGLLAGGSQMSALAWLDQGATASYGSVSEPCNSLQKFPNVDVLLRHYARGETVLEAYWKSVEMPGQGLFIGEPLARPYAASRR